MSRIFRSGLEVFHKKGFFTFIKEASRYVLWRFFGHLLILLVIRKFKSLLDKKGELEKIVEFSFSFTHIGVSISPAQVKEEIDKLLQTINLKKPKIVLEIGTSLGGTLFLFTRVADPEAIIISIDLPGGSFGGGYPKWKSPLYKSFSKDKQRIYLVRADSHDDKTLSEVVEILKDNQIDFLFIDGDHSYEGVKKDFEMYSPLVKKSGIIAFHDIVPHPPETGCEVNEFWLEIKDSYEHVEIVKDWTQGQMGIGVLFF